MTSRKVRSKKKHHEWYDILKTNVVHMISTTYTSGTINSHKKTDVLQLQVQLHPPMSPPTTTKNRGANWPQRWTPSPVGRRRSTEWPVRRRFVVRRLSGGWGVVEGDGCQKIRRFYHKIHECTMLLFWFKTIESIECCWNNISKIHSMYIVEDFAAIFLR